MLIALSCGHVSLAPVEEGCPLAHPALGASGARGAAVLLVTAAHGLRKHKGKQ